MIDGVLGQTLEGFQTHSVLGWYEFQRVILAGVTIHKLSVSSPNKYWLQEDNEYNFQATHYL